MDTIVQLLRDGLCCIKDLSLFQDTFLWDPSYTASVLGQLSEPMDQTTPLEVLIAIFQFYAFCSLTSSGFKLAVTSYGKLVRIERLMAVREKVTNNADRLINASLVKEGLYAMRFMFIGMLVFFIGCSFFWLTANSFHITQTDWIGGVPALIHALTVGEICLVPLLYYMYKDGTEQMNKADRMESLAEKMRLGNLSPKDMGLASVEALSGWLPFWDSGVSPLLWGNPSEEEKLMAEEKKRIQDILSKLVVTKKDDDKSEDDKVEAARLEAQADELLMNAKATRWEGYREFLYLVLNSIAFYGYAMAVLAFHWPVEDKQPAVIRRLMLQLPNSDADWHGNFAGDLMWTIEPIVVMSTPYLINSLRPKKEKKLKAD